MNRQEGLPIYQRIKEGDKRAFKALFQTFYPRLCIFAGQITKNPSEAEEIVQELFVQLWNDRSNLDIHTSLENYLCRSVKNKCLNHLKHTRIADDIKIKIHNKHIVPDPEAVYTASELLLKIENCIELLPEKRKEIFRLNRQEGLRYKEISQKLNISVKTVETQMTLAIKTLRKKLKEYRT